MTKNERMLKRVEVDLQEVQERQRARLLELYHVENLLEEAKERIEKLDRIERKYFRGIKFTLNHGVANAYRYPANTTEVYGKINKYGNIQEIFVNRTYAPKNGQGINMELNCIFE